MTLDNLGPLVWLIPAFTLAAFVVNVLISASGRNGRLAAWVAVLGIFASMVVTLPLFFAALQHGGESLSKHPYTIGLAWIPVGAGVLEFGWLLDPLSLATAAMVTIVCTLIFIFASSYMEGEFTAYRDGRSGETQPGTGHARYARFFAFVSLFATGMLGFVLAGNLLQALIFWEIMGLCSFLLIGFWYHKPSAKSAAIKAFLTTRIGDLFFMVGMFLLFGIFGTLNYEALVSAEGVARMAGLGTVAGIPIATIVAIFIFGGAVGKSAQFPLHVWLPDAMEGPTPVSALIHAATMVAAGVFLVARMFPLFEASALHGERGGALTLVALIGALTAVFAATIGVAQFDIKRVLAYSTISQLGYMIMALGLGAYVAAVFHLITHAFFKALLFLGSGSVIHGVEHGMHHAEHHDEHGHEVQHHPVAASTAGGKGGADPHDPQDMRNMGYLRQRMPITFWTFLLGTFALTGIPLFSGFWSKDEILAAAFYYGFDRGDLLGLLVWLAGTMGAFLTAFYMARQIFLVFFGQPSSEGARHAPESAPRMVYPLVGLAIFAVFLGFVGIHEETPILGPALHNPFHAFLGTLSDGSHDEVHHFNALPMAISILMVLIGWTLGWLLYGRDPAAARARDPLMRLGGLWTLLHRKYYVDELYQATFIRFSLWFAHLNALVDKYLVDGVVNGVGIGSEVFSRVNGWVDTHIVDGTVNLVGVVNVELSRGLKPLQSGRVQQYLLVVFFCLLFLLGAALL